MKQIKPTLNEYVYTPDGEATEEEPLQPSDTMKQTSTRLLRSRLVGRSVLRSSMVERVTPSKVGRHGRAGLSSSTIDQLPLAFKLYLRFIFAYLSKTFLFQDHQFALQRTHQRMSTPHDQRRL